MKLMAKVKSRKSFKFQPPGAHRSEYLYMGSTELGEASLSGDAAVISLYFISSLDFCIDWKYIYIFCFFSMGISMYWVIRQKVHFFVLTSYMFR